MQKERYCGLRPFLCVIWFLLGRTNAQFPVLYTSPRQNSSFVEDLDTGELLPDHVAFRFFVCSSKNGKPVLPCPKNLHIHTREAELTLVLSWMNPNLEFVRHPGKTTIEIYSVENGFIDRRIIHKEVESSIPDFKMELNLEGYDPVYLKTTIRNKTVGAILSLDEQPPKVCPSQKHVPTPFQVEIRPFPLPSEATEASAWFLVLVNEPGLPFQRFSTEGCFFNLSTDASEPNTVDALLFSSQQCPSAAIQNSFSEIIQVQGGIQTDFVSFERKVVVHVTFNTSQQEDLQIWVDSETFMDLSGNLNPEGANLTFYYRPTVGQPSKERRNRLLSRVIVFKENKNTRPGALLGMVASVSIGTTLATSAASGGASGNPGQDFPVYLLNIGQKLYLFGFLAVSNMPELYSDFSSGFSWSMFNIPSPFESLVSKQKEDSNASSNATDVLTSEREEIYLRLARVFFWVPLIVCVILSIHGFVLFLCLWRKKRIPVIFAFPRIEIMMIYTILPAITFALAGLLRGNRKDALVGVWLLTMLPGSMISWNVYMLYKYFYSKDPRFRSANFVVKSSLVPETSFQQLGKDWERMRRIQKEKQNPPILFFNGAYSAEVCTEPLCQNQIHACPDRQNFRSPNPPSRREAFSEDVSQYTFHFGVSSNRRSVERPRFSLASNGLPSSSHCVQESIGESSVTNLLDPIDSAESHRTDGSPFYIPWMFSAESSRNNSNYTTSADENFVVQIKHLTNVDLFQSSCFLPFDFEGSAGSAHSKTQKTQKGLFRPKYGTSERFQAETSNNFASLIAQTPNGSFSMSSRTNNVHLPASGSQNLEGPSCSYHNSHSSAIPFVESSREVELMPLDHEGHETTDISFLLCSSIPEPTWKTLLWREDRPKPSLPVTFEMHRPFNPILRSASKVEEPVPQRLSRISEISTSNPTQFLPLRPEMTDFEDMSHLRQSFIREQFIDNQLGISVLEPAFFYETAARLKYINKECLIEMGYPYLVPSDTSSESDNISEVEYQQRAKQASEADPNVSFRNLCCLLFDLSCFSLIMGNPHIKGHWQTSPYENNRFIARYGYLFEDFHGYPVLYRWPTYEVENGKMDRGKFVPLRRQPLLFMNRWRLFGTQMTFPGFVIYRDQIQILTRFLQLSKIACLGAMVAIIGQGKDSLIQIIVLIVLCLFLLTLLRISRPYPNRIQMAVHLTEEASDVLFLSLIVLLLLGPGNDGFRTKIGIGMISVELSSFLAIIGDRLILSFNGFSVIHQRRRNRKPVKLTFLFHRYLSKNAYFLQRKVFDRWMVKALKRGLYWRQPHRTELPVSYFLRQEIEKVHESLKEWLKEVYLVWMDFRSKWKRLQNRHEEKHYYVFQQNS